MVRYRVIILSVLILGLFMGILSFAFPFLAISIPPLAYFFSGARVLVEDLGLPEDARDVSEITVSAADGNAPEMARRFFRTDTSADEIRQFYVDRCSGLDMTAPPEDWLLASPEMICVETTTYRIGAGVHLYSNCDETGCAVTIEVQQ